MAINPSSPITGAAVSGLTSPTYTITADVAPDINGKQYAVTALGGTQTNVDVHSQSKPFTITYMRPKVIKTLGVPNPRTGLLSSVPRNTHKIIMRKGMTPLTGQAVVTCNATLTIDLPAGADISEPEEIRAMVSALFGFCNQQASGIADTLISGIL